MSRQAPVCAARRLSAQRTVLSRSYRGPGGAVPSRPFCLRLQQPPRLPTTAPLHPRPPPQPRLRPRLRAREGACLGVRGDVVGLARLEAHVLRGGRALLGLGRVHDRDVGPEPRAEQPRQQLRRGPRALVDGAPHAVRAVRSPGRLDAPRPQPGRHNLPVRSPPRVTHGAGGAERAGRAGGAWRTPA